MRSKKLTIALSFVTMMAISAKATPIELTSKQQYLTIASAEAVPSQVKSKPTGGGYVQIVDDAMPSNQPRKKQIIQKAVRDLNSAQTAIASMANDNRKLLANQKAFGIKMTQLKTYIKADLNNSSSCRVAEEQFKLKGSMSDDDKKTIDECYSYAESSLSMHSYIILMMKGLLQEMISIKNSVDSNGIKAKILEKRIVSLTAAIKVLGD